MIKPLIIGIHGMAPKPAKFILDERWTHMLNHEKKYNIGETFDFELCYWANVMGHSIIDEPESFGFVEQSFIHGLRGEARRNMVTHIETHISNYFKGIGEGFSSSSIFHKFLPDVYRYFNDSNIRFTCLNRLDRLVTQGYSKKQPIMLLAHSMGTIIALDYIFSSNRFIHCLVTLGSPLGFTVVKQNIRKLNDGSGTYSAKDKIILNKRIGTWYNLYDPLDVVSILGDIDDHWPTKLTLDIRVKNNYVTQTDDHGGYDRNHHKSYGYLRTPEMAEVLEDFLKVWNNGK